jgi:uncharacterized membrane protein
LPYNRRLIYNPFSNLMTTFIIIILVIVFILIFIGLVGAAFSRIGFSAREVIILFLATLAGSFINIPIATLESHEPVMTGAFVRVYGVTYRIPAIREESKKTVVAVNLGGALIPTAVSIYLLFEFPYIIPFAALGIVIVSSISHVVSKPVKGVGIVSPALVSPLTAALFSIVMSIEFLTASETFAVAYVCGVLGTLIGADISNIGKIKKIGAPIASIGGAGTFDGVFLSGIIAVLLA